MVDTNNTEVAVVDSTGSKDAPGMVMTIKLAQDLFIKYKPDFVNEMEGLVTLCRDNRVRDPFENGNYLHALTYTDLMLRHTTRSFRMITGGGGDGFVTILRPSFETMLTRLKKAKSFARIVILDNSTDTKTINELRNAFKDTLRVVWAHTTAKLRHSIVADGNMVRDEQWHVPLTPESDADIIKAKVYFDNPTAAAVFEGDFDSIWNRLVAPETAAANR